MDAAVQQILARYQQNSGVIENAAKELYGLYSGYFPYKRKSMADLLLDELRANLRNADKCGSVDLIIRFFTLIGEVERLLPVLFYEIHWTDLAIRDVWTHTIYTELSSCIQNHPTAFSSISLDEIEKHCQPLLHTRTKNLMAEMFSRSLIENVADLRRRAQKLRAEKG